LVIFCSPWVWVSKPWCLFKLI